MSRNKKKKTGVLKITNDKLIDSFVKFLIFNPVFTLAIINIIGFILFAKFLLPSMVKNQDDFVIAFLVFAGAWFIAIMAIFGIFDIWEDYFDDDYHYGNTYYQYEYLRKLDNLKEYERY